MLKAIRNSAAQVPATPLQPAVATKRDLGTTSREMTLYGPGGGYTDALRDYLETIRRLFGAPTASLRLDLGQGSDRSPLLLTTGTPDAIPELASELSASELFGAMPGPGRGNGKDHPQEAVSYYRSIIEDVRLIGIPLFGLDPEPPRGPSPRIGIERRRVSSSQEDTPEGAVWIGLRYGDSTMPSFFHQSPRRGGAPGPGQPLTAPEWMIRVLLSGARLAWQVYRLAALVNDSTTGLPRRPELQSYVERCLSEGPKKGRLFAVALINPDEFEQVNQRLGREGGDAVLREIAAVLQSSVRHPDRSFHFGGAVYSAVTWVADKDEAEGAVERIRRELNGHQFLNGVVRLSFSIGIWVSTTGNDGGTVLDSAEVLRRADASLNAAKVSGGGQAVVWVAGEAPTTLGSHDRLSGIFTADTRKDYRNMLLLWDTVQAISSQAETEAIACEFVALVSRTFRPTRVALAGAEADGSLGLLAVADGEGIKRGVGAMLLGEGPRRLIARAQQSRKAEQTPVAAPLQGQRDGQAPAAYAVPLLSGARYLGALYLEGSEASVQLDSSDLVFLTVLAQQVAVAMDHAQLAMHSKREQELQSRQLRGEVRELRQALHHSRLIYQSAQMQSLLELARKVAPSEATVLVIGESGTGKEMIARALHEHSLRRKEPFVTVDCGAIAHGLMESELFGYAKGAYTGASARSPGRIAHAEGGTLFLDEIGEIPLEVQAKLLRFVQEKEIMPVGATRPCKVNVRIVAATNRDLAAEAAAGRFRQDLYYRLQVVTLTVPPLRERPDDILPLARYFLEKFALQYERGVRCLAVEAETALRGCRWPGNVRELQNRMLQAVLMCGSDRIDAPDLGLSGQAAAAQVPRDGTLLPVAREGEDAGESLFAGARTTVGEASESVPLPGDGARDDPWDLLQAVLALQVATAINRGQGDAVPLGVWLTEDLVLAADRAHGGTARQAATAIGMPESTFRRHLDKGSRLARAGLSVRTDAWSAVAPALEGLSPTVRGKPNENLVLRARRLLLREVISRLPEDDAFAASLMGVTVPTYRNWKAGEQRRLRDPGQGQVRMGPS